MPSWIALVVALFSGLAMAVQGSMNAVLGKITGMLEATLIVHGSAALVVGAALFAVRQGSGDLVKVVEAPWYLWSGGFIGVLITYGVVTSIPRVGACLATTAIIIGQVTTAMVIDHLGLFGLDKLPVSWTQLAGLVLLGAGGWLMLH